MTSPAGEFNLGRPRAYIEVDANGVRTGIADAQRQLQNFRGQMADFVTNTGRQLRDFGSMWSLAMLPVAGAIGTGINAAADFDSVLTEIAARTGLGTEAMQQIKQAALDAGAASVFSSQQAAEAFLQLTTAGMDYESALATLPAVIDAAAAGNIDLGLSADYVTNVMSVFGLEAENVTDVVNAMSQSAASSPADIAQMGEALQVAGGSAQAFGLDVQQTSAILAIFANNGLRGSEAGNGLRSMLRNLSRDVPAVQEAWQELGISMYDANGNARDLDAVFGELRTALDSLPVAEQNRLIQTLAGAEGELGFRALLASEGITAMQETMESQASAADVAQQMMQTFRNQVNSLKGSVETLMITAFTPFMNNVLRPIIGMLISATNAVTAWAGQNEGLVQTIVSILAVMVAAGPAMMIVGQAIMFIGGAIGIILSPIGLLVGAVAGIAFMFRDRLMPAIQSGLRGFSSFTDILGDTNDYVGAFVSSVAAFMMNFALSLGMPMQAAFRMVDTIEGAFFGMRVLIGTFINDLQSFGLGEAILGIFGRGMTPGDSALEGLFFRMGFSREAAIRMTNQVFTAFSMWFTRLRSLFTRVSDAVMPAFREISTFLSGNAGSGIASFAQTLFNIGTYLMRIGNPLTLLRNVLDFFGIDLLSIFENAMQVIAKFFWGLNHGFSIVNALRIAFNNSDFINNLIDAFRAVGSIINNQVIPALTTAWNFFTGLWTAFTTSGWSGAATFIQDNLITPLQTAWNNIDWSQVGTDVMNGIGTAISNLITGATWFYNTFISPMIASAATAIATTDWSQVGTDIINGIGTAIGLTFDFLTWLTTNVLAPMVTNAGTAIESINWFAVGEGIVNAIGTALTTTFDFIAWIVNSIFNPITDNADGASTGIDWYSVGETILTAVKDSLIATFNFIQWLIDTIFQPLINGAASAITQTDWSAVGTNLMDAIKNALPNIAQWVQDNIITPITNSLSNFNPMQNIQTASPGTIARSTIGGGGNAIFGGISSFISNLPGFDVGTNYVPNDMVAMLHEGEAVVPAKYNPANNTSIAGGDIHISIGQLGNVTPSEAKDIAKMIAEEVRKQTGGGRKDRSVMDTLHAKGLRR